MAITISLGIIASGPHNFELLSHEAHVIALRWLTFLSHSYAEVSTGYLAKEYRYLQLMLNNWSSGSQHQSVRAVWLGGPTKQGVNFQSSYNYFVSHTVLLCANHWVLKQALFAGVMTFYCSCVIKVLYSLHPLFNNSFLSSTVTVSFFSLCIESHCREWKQHEGEGKATRLLYFVVLW